MAKGKKTGGRQKGTPNKITAEREKEIEASGLTPLEFMLRLLRNSKATLEDRKWAANAAAPYCHPRLATVDHRGAVNLKHENVNPERVRDDIASIFAEPAKDEAGGDQVVH